MARAREDARALARQGYYSEDLASEVRAMEARFESGLAAARAENDGLRTNLEISRGNAAREEAECRRLEAEIDELGLELEHTRAEADRARAEANAHEEAAASASAAAGVAADRLLSAEKSREEKRDRIVEMVKAEAEGKIAQETTRMAAEHARRRKLFDDVVANLTGRCEASDKEKHDRRRQSWSSPAASWPTRADDWTELHRAVPNVLANVHRRWKLEGRDGTRMARVVFATWRHVAVIARESERLNRCVEELVRERAERDAVVREAARTARLDAETRLDGALVRLESANHALTTDLRDARDAAKLARGEVARLARLRETDSTEARAAEDKSRVGRVRGEGGGQGGRAPTRGSAKSILPGAIAAARRSVSWGWVGDRGRVDRVLGRRRRLVHPRSSPDSTQAKLARISGSGSGDGSSPRVASSPSRRASSRDPHVLLSRAKSAARASSQASAGWGRVAERRGSRDAAAVARGLRRGDEARRARRRVACQRGRGRVPGAGASRGEAVQRAAGVRPLQPA